MGLVVGRLFCAVLPVRELCQPSPGGFIPIAPLLTSSNPPATPPPTPTPTILFLDDFSDPNSGWPVYNDEQYMDDYYNGAYRMVENDINTTSWVYPDEFDVNDVMITVDATKNAGPDENDMGLICRYQNEDRIRLWGLLPVMVIDGITKMTPDDFNVIGSEYLEYSDLINQGSATNTIKFDCIGDVLTLYVNGYQLDQRTDTEYTAERLV